MALAEFIFIYPAFSHLTCHRDSSDGVDNPLSWLDHGSGEASTFGEMDFPCMAVCECDRGGDLCDGTHMSGGYRTRVSFLKVWLALGATFLVACQAPIADTGKALYAARCAACHGDTGHGDGPVARKLPDSPTRFSDPAWRKSVNQAYVREVITYGGSHMGISPLMPSSKDIGGNEPLMNELIAFVLQLGK